MPQQHARTATALALGLPAAAAVPPARRPAGSPHPHPPPRRFLPCLLPPSRSCSSRRAPRRGSTSRRCSARSRPRCPAWRRCPRPSRWVLEGAVCAREPSRGAPALRRAGDVAPAWAAGRHPSLDLTLLLLTPADPPPHPATCRRTLLTSTWRLPQQQRRGRAARLPPPAPASRRAGVDRWQAAAAALPLLIHTDASPVPFTP